MAEPDPNAIPLPRSRRRDHLPPVYFIRAEGGGPIKIGRSWNPESRLAQMQTGHPDTLELLGVVYDQPESFFHARFGHLRIRGEWFKGTPELLRFIREWDES